MHTEQHMRELYKGFVANRNDKHLSRRKIHYSRNGYSTLCGIDMNVVYGPFAEVANKWIYTLEWVVLRPDEWCCKTCWHILERLEPEWVADYWKRSGVE